MRAPTVEHTRPVFYAVLSGTRGMPKRHIPNILVSAGSLWSPKRGKFVRRRPPSHDRFFLDSGGFTCLDRFGDFPWSHGDYVDLIRHYKPDFAATMDYPCEPDINRKLYLGGADGSRTRCALETNEERILATFENAVRLVNTPVGAPTVVVPVLQGYVLEEYLFCLELYREHGVLDQVDYLAVGSMCRRESVPQIAKLVVAVSDAVWTTHPDIRLHLFGLKLSALRNKAVHDRAHSVDSAAWSLSTEPDRMYAPTSQYDDLLDGYLAKVDEAGRENDLQITFRDITDRGVVE